VNRTRLFLLGSVTLALGSLVCFVIYNNLQTRSGARKEPMIDVVLDSKVAAEDAGAYLPAIIPSGTRAVSVPESSGILIIIDPPMHAPLENATLPAYR
jgi:hypothetical protein